MTPENTATIDYTSRYGLEFNPFIKGPHEIVVETADYAELDIRLNYLLNNKGIGIVTGSPGCGKTTAIRNFVRPLNPSLYKVVYMPLSTLTVSEFYRQLAIEFSIEAFYKKTENFKSIQAEISRYSVEKRITPIIIIDEANHLNNAVLNELKMLLNFDMDSRDRAIMLLVGLKVLNNTLRLSANEALRQRITMNYNIESLKKDEVYKYIRAKLRGARGSTEIFNENAMEAIANASNGIPRLINKICNNSMIVAGSKDADEINAEIVMLAVSEGELA